MSEQVPGTTTGDGAAGEAERRRKLRASFARYRIMAFVVGTMLLLVFLFFFLRLGGAHVRGVEQWLDPLHGYLYLLYLVAAADLAIRAKWRLGRIVAVVLAGWVPFLAFYVEHRVRVQMQAEEGAALAGPSGGPSDEAAADPSPAG